MKNIVLISASPKLTGDSASKYLIEMAGDIINEPEMNKIFIDVRQSIKKLNTAEDFATLAKADAVIIAFPLYVFCLPGILMRFLDDYQQFLIEHGKTHGNTKVYAIVNCGFPEPEINLEAVRVIRSFCQHVNAQFRFGVLIGGGGMLLGAKEAPFMKKTLQTLNEAFLMIAQDIQSNDGRQIANINIKMNFPRWLYMFMGDLSWKSEARKNGLKKKDLYRQPYHNA